MLEIRSLTRRFGGQLALDAVSLEVPVGQVACLVGPSGCGKSTLLRLVAGLDRPDAGEIRAGGRLLSAPGWALEARRRGLNMVFQDYALWPHLSVERIVGYGLNHLPRAERRARVASWLERMRIAPLARRLPSQISGGQQQRVAIARALATDPAMLLMDEPLSNLDVQLRIEMRREFAQLFAELGKTVLYVTHDPLEAAAFADILVVMKAGRIAQQGSPEALFAQPRSEWIATLAGYDTRIRGQVVGQAGADWLIRVAGQALRLPPAAAADPGYRGPVAVLMRHAGPAAEDGGGFADGVADGAAGGAEGGNRLSGRVLASLYEGRDWRTEIDLGEGRIATALLPRRARPGARVTIALPPGTALAFADPDAHG